ncbi:hypothetical protein [Listeria booriae]|uniref:hypothetical protein n=1 Tax=Listeria booriae TaxID=1552123 RepID=UPI001C8A84CB|nr:hypothetical protein [Listeria booriae]
MFGTIGYREVCENMSFVSIVGNKKFINVVSDGLAVWPDRREQNFKKFNKIKGKFFIAYAGTVTICLSVREQVLDMFNSGEALEHVIDTVSRNLSHTVYNENNKAMICIGGKNTKGKLVFATMSNKPYSKLHRLSCDTDDIKYAFLQHHEGSLIAEKEFCRLAQESGSISSKRMLQTQKKLSVYMSKLNPDTVNEITFSTTITV